MRPNRSIALGCLAALVAPAALAQGQTSEWKPAPATLTKLGPEAKFEGWSLRPPKGWSHRVTREATESRFSWGKDGIGSMVVLREAAQPLSRTPDDVLGSSIGALKARIQGLRLAEPERGTIGGRPFVRMRFRMETQPQMPGLTSGFVYATAEAGTPVVILGFANAASVAEVEAAAQTYRSQGAAAPAIGSVAADEPGKPLVDQKRQIPVDKEWNCPISPSRAGTLSIKVEGKGPFSIILIADRSYQALLKGNRPTRSDVLLDIQSPGARYEGKVKVPKGTAWFIIGNGSGAAADFHLECTPTDR